MKVSSSGVPILDARPSHMSVQSCLVFICQSSFMACMKVSSSGVPILDARPLHMNVQSCLVFICHFA